MKFVCMHALTLKQETIDKASASTTVQGLALQGKTLWTYVSVNGELHHAMTGGANFVPERR